MQVCIDLSASWKPYRHPGLPDAFCGGFVGYTAYDTVRYVYAEKLPFANAPRDDRGLADIHLGLYQEVVVFDHATKLAYCVTWVDITGHESVEEAFINGCVR